MEYCNTKKVEIYMGEHPFSGSDYYNEYNVNLYDDEAIIQIPYDDDPDGNTWFQEIENYPEWFQNEYEYDCCEAKGVYFDFDEKSATYDIMYKFIKIKDGSTNE